MTVADFLAVSEDYLSTNGFACLKSVTMPGQDLPVPLYATKTGRSFGPFFPYEDCIFFHDFTCLPSRDRAILVRLHESERGFVNSRYKLPKVMRYKVPNITTVFISVGRFPPAAAEYAAENTIDPIGGERHQVLLVDLESKSIVSQGREMHHAYGVPLEFKTVSPINRGMGIVWKIMEHARFSKDGGSS